MDNEGGASMEESAYRLMKGQTDGSMDGQMPD